MSIPKPLAQPFVFTNGLQGSQGPPGPAGPAGPGVATGGNTDDVLVKNSGTNYDTAWTDAVKLDKLTFDTAAAETLTTAGELAWDTNVETALLQLNAGVALHMGQEVFYHVKNQTGSTITKGTVVRASGTLGASGRILIAPFLADGTYPSQVVMGVVTEDIADGDDGFVTHFGLIRGIDTDAFNDFDILYASDTVSGGFVANTPPTAPNNHVIVALVVHAATNGSLFVRPTFGSSLADDELVDLSGLADKDALVYNSTSGVFEPEQVVLESVVDAKGDLLVGTAADTVGRLAVGANGTSLIADSAETAGLKWAVPASPAAQYVTLATDSSLSNERVLTAGTGISITDAGANSSVTLAVLPRFKPPSTEFLRAAANNTTAVAVQSRLTFLPIELAACSLDRISCNVSTGAASTTVRLGVYASDSSGFPGALVFDAGTVDSSTNGVKSITINQSLSGGRYWLAAVAQGGTPTMYVGTNSSMFALGFQRTFASTQPASNTDMFGTNPTVIYETGVTGSLPSTATPRYDATFSNAIMVSVRIA